MKKLKTYVYLSQALLDKSRLDDAGVETFVSGENTGTIGYGGMFNEISLQVADEDLEKARAIFANPPEPLADDADTGNGPAPFVNGPDLPEPAVWKFFVGGGIAAELLLVGVCLLAILTGGIVEMDSGAIVALFIMGGLLGLIVRVIYVRGLQHGRRWADERR